MRVGLGQFQDVTDERLAFVKQCGWDDFQMNMPNPPGSERWDFADLARLVEQGQRSACG